MLNIFHISDLHYTIKKGRTRDEARASSNAILKLATTLSSLGVLSRPILVITGDLVNTGGVDLDDGPNDYDAVYNEFLLPLMNIMKITAKDVYLVPGNHEMDRDIIKETDRISLAKYNEKRLCEADLHADLCRKLDTYFSFIENHNFNSVTRDEPRLKLFTRDNIDIACFNGLVGSYSQSTEKGELFIANTEIRGVLTDLPRNTITLMHHPLSWFDDDSSTSLRDLLMEKSVRLLTGHIHQEALEHTEGRHGSLVQVHAGASGDRNGSTVSVAWMKEASNAAAVRSFVFDPKRGGFPITAVDKTECAPPKSYAFFSKTKAFFNIDVINQARKLASEKFALELKRNHGRDFDDYVCPDLVTFKDDSLSVERVSYSQFANDRGNRLISGGELSGKSSFILYGASLGNKSDEGDKKLHLSYDFRRFRGADDFKTEIEESLHLIGVKRADCENLLESGVIQLWIDNFNPEPTPALKKFITFLETYPSCRWTLAVRGSQRYTHANAPTELPQGDVSYYELSEVTMRTAIQIIRKHSNAPQSGAQREVVERVFKSIKNLQAPRTIFYVDSLIDLFLTGEKVEPLNRYLLIANLLTDRMKAAHQKHMPEQLFDMALLEVLIALIAYNLLENKTSHISKGNLLVLIEGFIERKGMLKKNFNPQKVIGVLEDSFILREDEGYYSFLMLSIEDFFLAKHMSIDSNFRDSVMSADGLLALPTVAEFYVAQNPSDRQRIDSIFEVIDAFEKEIAPLIKDVKAISRDSIWNAAPGQKSKIEDDLVKHLGEAEAFSDEPILVNPNPSQTGTSKRLNFSSEERGAVLLQLGSSIVGVTRTLDLVERKEIFQRLRPIILISLHTVPLVAEHLAAGGVINYRGVTVRSEYKGDLSVPENRYYLILRTMIYNVMKRFAVWSGSPSFFNAAMDLRSLEEDELVRTALYAQNIEADLSEAVKFIEEIDQSTTAPILKDVIIRQYVEAMMLVPFDRDEQVATIDKLVDMVIALKPPKDAKNPGALERLKTDQRQKFLNRLSFNQFIGKLGRSQ